MGPGSENVKELVCLINDLKDNTTPAPESSLVKMSESGHFTVINLINWCD